jgi:hypothetical protein
MGYLPEQFGPENIYAATPIATIIKSANKYLMKYCFRPLNITKVIRVSAPCNLSGQIFLFPRRYGLLRIYCINCFTFGCPEVELESAD